MTTDTVKFMDYQEQGTSSLERHVAVYFLKCNFSVTTLMRKRKGPMHVFNKISDVLYSC